MKRLLLTGAALALLAFPARAQVGQLYGAYNAATVTLNSGQFYPLQVDQNANLKVDCVIGCSGASGGGTGVVSQGTPGASASAWPFYLTQGSGVVGPANGLAVTDTNDGTAASGVALPAGASGELGWLSAIDKALSGTIVVQPSGNTATTDTADGASPSSGAANSGSGLLGWLGTIATDLSGTLTVRQSGTVTVTPSGTITTTGTNDGTAPASGTSNGGSGSLGWLGTIATELTALAADVTGTLTVAPASSAIFNVTDTDDGTASSSAQMSNNGVGFLGWLSTVVVKLSNTLNVAQVAAGTVADTSVSIATTSTTAVAATTGVRYRATLTNTSTASGNTVWCRADGGIASVGTGIQIPANGGGYEWTFPLTGAKPAPAITCIATSAAALVGAEYVQ